MGIILATTLLLTASMTTVSAAGDASLERRIVKDALPGWTPLPNEVLERLAASEQGGVSGATSRKVTVAADGWRRGPQSLLVVLIAFPDSAPPSDFRPRDAVTAACATGTLSAPRTLETYSAIAGSAEATCAGRNGSGVAVAATVMAWKQQSVFALVIGNRFTKRELETFAVKQDAALSAKPSQIGHESDSGSAAWAVFVIIAVAIVLGLIVFLLVARSRSRMPAPVQALSGYSAYSNTYLPPATKSAFAAPAPTPAAPTAESGWQPVEGDHTRIAYWDGTRFTAWMRWDGTNWVDWDQ
jgi:hypothetical protein